MPQYNINHSLEQVCDGMIKLLVKNLGARTTLTSNAFSGSSTISVDNTFHFREGETVMLIDINEGHVEFHSLLTINSTTSFTFVEPLSSNFLISDKSIVQRAIHGIPLAENSVLLGDRSVIPNEDVVITVDPSTMDQMEWMYIRGGLSVNYGMTITIYIKLDDHELAERGVLKYGDAAFNLLINNLHLDIVNDEMFITQDVNAGDTVVNVPTTTGWTADAAYRYELQDNNHSEIDFSILQVSSGQITLNRQTSMNFKVADKALFRRRVRYLWNSLVSNIEYGYIQKGSQMYKAARLNWWGKEAVEVMFPQTTKGGIT